MKSRILLLTLFLLASVATLYAQTPVQGIAIQGIARDATNAARKNAAVIFNFTFYHNDQPNPFSYPAPAVTLTTDNFGVFSHIMDVNSIPLSTFANHQIWLKIEADGVVVSDQPFKHVPYAIAAYNGVPTGSIMPYMGTSAPAGWLLCDGTTKIPAGSPLALLLGQTTTPNLQGMFLRGAGTSSLSPQVTTLGGNQDDTFLNHEHIVSANDGDHQHETLDIFPRAGPGSVGFLQNGTAYGLYTEPGQPTVAGTGNHNHDIKVLRSETPGVGNEETRPVNYGVNYIIKL